VEEEAAPSAIVKTMSKITYRKDKMDIGG